MVDVVHGLLVDFFDEEDDILGIGAQTGGVLCGGLHIGDGTDLVGCPLHTGIAGTVEVVQRVLEVIGFHPGLLEAKLDLEYWYDHWFLGQG